ncbi:MAG: YihY/virulence factor BrkB family protein, partial [Bacteroidota bacterium]|nr:YihY/virulence factor BrkB family protein [Bacteroidota bacterium]
MGIKRFFSDTGKIFKNAFQGFSDDKVLKLSGSLAYTMVFSMGPLILIIITTSGFFFGREAIEGRIYHQLEGIFGHDTAVQLQDIIKHAFISGKSTFATVIGAIFLFIGATGIFSEIQDSINMIWGVKPKPKKGWVAFLKNRLLSFSVIIGLGFLLLVSLAISAVVEAFGDRLKILVSGMSTVLLYIINLLVSIGISGFIFAVIFKVLPDAQIKWKDVWIGALATTLLFLLGKFGISFYISKINVGSTYGTAGSIVVLLLWIYYSSLILYFGAEFTMSYAMLYG